jgi:hypothetical protein
MTILITLHKRVSFSEVTGGRALSFRDVSMGEAAGLPLDRAGGNAEGAKLPCRYVAEKTSPRALELRKSPPAFRKHDVC